MPCQSNNNAVLYDSCRPLQDLAVLLEVTEDISTVEGNGFSLQVNCNPQPGHYFQGEQLTDLQYVVLVESDNLYWAVQYGTNGSNYKQGAPFGPLVPGTVLPRQSQLQVLLQTAETGDVTGVRFAYTDPNANVFEHVFSFTADISARSSRSRLTWSAP